MDPCGFPFTFPYDFSNLHIFMASFIGIQPTRVFAQDMGFML